MMDPSEIKDALSRGGDPSGWAQRIRDEMGNDPRALEGLLEGLVKAPLPQLGPLLKELLGLLQQKKAQKAVKRAIFKLRQRGVQMETPTEGRPVLRSIRAPEPRGQVGAMDVRGRRFLILERPTPRAAVGYIALGSPGDGLMEFFRVETTRKAWRELLAERVISPVFPLVEAPAAYCWYLIRELAEVSQKVPPDYERALKELGELKWDGPVPIIYQFVRPEEVQGRTSFLRASEGLFSIPPFSVWLLEKEEVKPWVEELRRAEESPLALTDRQKAERREGIITRALEELFPEERRLAMKRQLEEMAYFLWARDERDRAKAALAAALQMERPPSPFTPHPFLRSLLFRSMALFEQERQGEESPILLP